MIVVVVLVVIVVVRVLDLVVRVLVAVRGARGDPGMRMAVVLVVVGVLVAMRGRPVRVRVLVLPHGSSFQETAYHPCIGPTITIGPVGLFEPPAGSIETANAFTSSGRSTFASCVT